MPASTESPVARMPVASASGSVSDVGFVVGAGVGAVVAVGAATVVGVGAAAAVVSDSDPPARNAATIHNAPKAAKPIRIDRPTPPADSGGEPSADSPSPSSGISGGIHVPRSPRSVDARTCPQCSHRSTTARSYCSLLRREAFPRRRRKTRAQASLRSSGPLRH